MNADLIARRRMHSWAAIVVTALSLLAPTRSQAAPPKPAVGDLTAGGKLEEKAARHTWNLGPTGLRGAMYAWQLATADARQILVTKVDKGSPADGLVQVGDVILGVGGAKFSSDARKALGNAITQAETAAGAGKLQLLLWRNGKEQAVTVPLRVMGSYASQWPYGGCEKSEKIIEFGAKHALEHMSGNIPGEIDALALLATGDAKYVPAIRKLARELAPKDLDLDGVRGMVAWSWGYRNLFLTEYYLATGDREVLPAIRVYSNYIARGQNWVGTWGHGMAWPEDNGGQLHGHLGGYGALNQAGEVCLLSLVLAEKCGVKDKEVLDAINRGCRFFSFYINKGSVPYGDHNPWHNHGSNGKNGIAAVMFDVNGRADGAFFFGRMIAASYGERELGHTGNFFSFLWGPLGTGRVGPAATSAFLDQNRWYYDLARKWDGSFGYQGADKSDKYFNWDCTGAYLLTYLLPREKLYITGRGRHKSAELTGEALADTIGAGRASPMAGHGLTPYLAKSNADLLKDLASWSPTVRDRASQALAKKPDQATIDACLKMLTTAEDPNARYGACAALGAMKAAAAVPELTKALDSNDVWLRIQATYALSAIGDPARNSGNRLLDLAAAHNPQDPREITQRYLCYALFYPGGAMGKAGLFAKSIEGLDRDKLYTAVRRLLTNDDGRARGTISSIYKHLTYDQLKPLFPAIYKAIRDMAPSDVMFADGIRLRSLDLFAQYRVREGMDLCIDIMEINRWGKHRRIEALLDILDKYGPAAKAEIPRLRDLAKRIRAHPEKTMAKHADRIDAMIKKLEAQPDDTRPLRSLNLPAD